MVRICSRGAVGFKCASDVKAFVKEREKPPPAPPKEGRASLRSLLWFLKRRENGVHIRETAGNVGTHGSCVRSNNLIKPSSSHSYYIILSGRTGRASLHTKAIQARSPLLWRGRGEAFSFFIYCIIWQKLLIFVSV